MKPELVCPAGALPALKAAVDAGADCVYIGLPDNTNARNFPGLNFDMTSAREGIRYAHAAGRQVFLAINTYAQAAAMDRWYRAVDTAAELGVDAVILADPGVMRYAAEKHPDLRLHLSVQGSATSAAAINLYARSFGVQRAVLPRVLSLQQVEQVVRESNVEIEVFGFGSLCVMAEGRCSLSSYATGESPNTHGVCSPASAVRWEPKDDGMDARLNGILIDRFDNDERAGYPTLCKGRFEVANETYYAIEEPVSLNTMSLLPALAQMGVAAIKIEGRQRSPAYVSQVTRAWRAAIDAADRNPARFAPDPAWRNALARVSEGQQVTFGAYERKWR
ncbi:MAG TPA: peptidase U32 family protein [Burkholderiales bacterium]|nr:peptidase U32 family protein [Burkholderiales bacterium]